MAKSVEILVSDEAYERLKKKAEASGVSPSAYLVVELEALAARPTKEEILERIRSLPPMDPGFSSAELVREGREEREEQLWQAITHTK